MRYNSYIKRSLSKNILSFFVFSIFSISAVADSDLLNLKNKVYNNIMTNKNISSKVTPLKDASFKDGGHVASFYLINKDMIVSLSKGKDKNKYDGSEELIRLHNDNRFTGEYGSIVDIKYYKNGLIKTDYFVGITENKKQKNEILKYKILGAKILDYCIKHNIQMDIVLHEYVGSEVSDDKLLDVAFGISKKNYSFKKYVTVDKDKLKDFAKNIFIDFKDKPNVTEIANLHNSINALNLVRDLVNEPANVIYPESFAKIIKDKFSGTSVSVDILGNTELKKLGFNAMLGVSQGSAKEPKLVIMKYIGNKKNKDFDLAIVGKGVTFDSGGLSLKPSEAMEDMKMDMAGAATTFGAIQVLSERKAKANVIGIVGLVENMPSGDSQKPGDIVKSLSGQTIEVLNTDAEGRLVLADVLYYTQTKYSPKYIIDFATLTGAVVVALGEYRAAVYSNDSKFASSLVEAGEVSGDLCWYMPIDEYYNKLMDSEVADMRNISTAKQAGSITAAAFLQRFIANNKSWAHIDIAGVAKRQKGTELDGKGASGFGVKLVDDFVARNFE
jgi:leucyl aminopeptidase